MQRIVAGKSLNVNTGSLKIDIFKVGPTLFGGRGSEKKSTLLIVLTIMDDP